MQAFFASNKPDESEQARQFCAHFHVVLKKLQDVGGRSGDYRVVSLNSLEFPLSTVIEFKNDKRSLRTKNLYLEYKQTIDGGFTTKTSGIELAVQQGDVCIIKSGAENFILRSKEEYKQLLEKSHGDVRTGKEINGNLKGCFTNGYLVKLTHVRKILPSYSYVNLF